jgi:hypothetical protein
MVLIYTLVPYKRKSGYAKLVENECFLVDSSNSCSY